MGRLKTPWTLWEERAASAKALAPRPDSKPYEPPSLLDLDYRNSRKLNAGFDYVACSVDTPGLVDTSVLDCGRRYLASTTASHLMLLGNVGTGKTYTAVSCAARLMGEQGKGLFIKARDLSDYLGFSDEAKAYRRRLVSTPVLVIDDLKLLGEGTVTEALTTWLDDLFDERHRWRRPTIITSNATLGQIKATYKKRFADRFAESGMVFDSQEKSLRRRLVHAKSEDR